MQSQNKSNFLIMLGISQFTLLMRNGCFICQDDQTRQRGSINDRKSSKSLMELKPAKVKALLRGVGGSGEGEGGRGKG